MFLLKDVSGNIYMCMFQSFINLLDPECVSITSRLLSLLRDTQEKDKCVSGVCMCMCDCVIGNEVQDIS